MTFDTRTHASPHLKWSELACRDKIGTPYPLDWRETRGRELAGEFERIRARVGKPIRISSAYRTPERNREVGGKPKSQHMQGRALDLVCPHEITFDQFVAYVKAAAAEPESLIRYVCVYRSHGFCHVDTRETKRLVVEDA